MSQQVRIALDAMGGDTGSSVVIPGAELFHARRPETRFLVFGDERVVAPLLAARPTLAAACRFVHTPVWVNMDDKPSQALRRGRRVSSMWLALEAVKKGEADVAVSAGNTGALMAMAKYCLRTMERIDRPAIAGVWPTLRGNSIVLDVGASIGADAKRYVDLAIVGAAMASVVFNLVRPSVGLLNVGVEEIKGLEEMKAAARILREIDLPGLGYHGFVEGDDIGKGVVDVVVTEGFTGNIALKTAEGTARQISMLLREAMKDSLMTRLGFFLARPAFRKLRDKLDPSRVNGGVFLGLDGIVIKSHGGADVAGFCGAIENGYQMVLHGLLDIIRGALAHSPELPTREPGHAPAIIAGQ